MSDVSQILSRIEQGDLSSAEQLLPLVNDELRKLAADKSAGYTFPFLHSLVSLHIFAGCVNVSAWECRRDTCGNRPAPSASTYPATLETPYAPLSFALPGRPSSPGIVECVSILSLGEVSRWSA